MNRNFLKTIKIDITVKGIRTIEHPEYFGDSVHYRDKFHIQKIVNPEIIDGVLSMSLKGFWLSNPENIEEIYVNDRSDFHYTWSVKACNKVKQFIQKHYPELLYI